MHYGNDMIGTDLLPTLVFSSGGVLPSGDYSLWVQETGGPVSYGFDFVISSVTPIPEPDIYTLLLAGLGLVTFVARRRSTAAAALLEADHPSRSFGLLTIRRGRLEMK